MMTRKEAIQILSTRDAHGVLCGYTSGVTEALDMAISALQAEPYTDTVSITDKPIGEFDASTGIVIYYGKTRPSDITHEIHTKTHGVCSNLINKAEALEQMAQAECGLHYDDCEADNCSCSYIQRILDIPLAEVVQGEWVRKVKEYNDCDGHRAYYWYECSECGAKPPKDTWGNEWHSDYCPSCGARMENEK